MVVAQTATADAPAHGGTVEFCDRRRILVVDDEASIVRLFTMLLEHGLPDKQVDAAGDGAEAVEKFAAGHHGVIIMDLHMPVMDGLNAFRNIESSCRARGWQMPAVVFCTGYVPPDSVIRAVAGGAAHCILQKPVLGDILVRTVAARLGS